MPACVCERRGKKEKDLGSLGHGGGSLDGRPGGSRLVFGRFFLRHPACL